MAYMMSFIRSFIIAILCVNPVMVVASQQSQQRQLLPVPSFLRYSEKDSSTTVFPGGLLLAGFLRNVGAIDLSNVGMPDELVTKVKTVVDENKVMLGVAIGATSLLLLTKHLKNSKKFGPWCHQNYVKITQSMDDTKNSLVKQLPDEVQTAIWLLGTPFNMLYGFIQKYIGMSQTTIVSSAFAPVTGKLLDCVTVCPFPLCTYSGLGLGASGLIVVKGYIDQQAEENRLLHVKTQEDIAAVANTIALVDKKIEKLGNQLSGIDTKTDNFIQEIKTCNETLNAVGPQLSDLANKLGNMDTSNVAKFSELFTQYDSLKQSNDKLLGNLFGQMSDMQEQLKITAETGQKNDQTLEEVLVQVTKLGKEIVLLEQIKFDNEQIKFDNEQKALEMQTSLSNMQQTNKETYDAVNKLARSYEESAFKTDQALSTLQVTQKNYDEKINTFLDGVEKVKQDVFTLTNEVKQNYETLDKKISRNHNETMAVLNKQVNSLQEKIVKMQETQEQVAKEQSKKLDTLVLFTEQCQSQPLTGEQPKKFKQRKQIKHTDSSAQQNNQLLLQHNGKNPEYKTSSFGANSGNGNE